MDNQDVEQLVDEFVRGDGCPPLECAEAQRFKSKADMLAAFAEWDAMPDEGKREVLRGLRPCPVCGGRRRGDGPWRTPGWVYAADMPCLAPCRCRAWRLYASRFAALVPESLRHMDGALEPCAKAAAPLEFQRRVVELLKAAPAKSYAFFGKAGTGKTSLSMWLFIRALKDAWLDDLADEPRRSSASSLVRAHHAWITDDTGDVPEPAITADWAAHGAGMPRVWLSEMEKIGPQTEYKYEVLFTILDALYEKAPRCQLVLDTNLTLDQFEEYFTDKIARRVAELCWRVDYFAGEILPPGLEAMR
jgi:hypothetical protein